MKKDPQYYAMINQLGETRPNCEAFLLGASMIQDFIVNKTIKLVQKVS